MSEELFPYYERELLFVRQFAQEFAKLYPAAAGRLLLEQNRSADPHIDIPRYIRLMRAGKLSLDGLVTDEFPLEQVNEAIALVRKGEAGRVLLRME